MAVADEAEDRAKAAAGTFETDRLRMRLHNSEDFESCVKLWTDPQVTQFIGGRPATSEEVWFRILRYRGLWALLGYGYWLIEERSTGRMIGEIGLADFKREMEPQLAAPEMGWALMPDFWGKGYATEAVAGVLAWSDDAGIQEVLAMIDPGNKPSLVVAAKCGFEPSWGTTYKGAEVGIYSRLRPQEHNEPKCQ